MPTRLESTEPSNSQAGEIAAGRRALGRWQFSLRELMLFVLLVAMGLSLFVTARRFLRDEAELAEYRREYGILTVENPTMLHAVARWTPEPGQWRWRVHLPPGSYRLRWRTTGIPREGLPRPEGDIPIDPAGLTDISVVACKDPHDGVWKYALTYGNELQIHTTHVKETCMQQIKMPVGLPNENGYSLSGVQWGHEPAVVSPQEPLVLLRKRLARKDKSGSYSTNFEALDGLMLWITRMGDASGQGTRAQ